MAVPNSEATRFKAGEKQVEIARKGGIASGEAKRRKSSMRKLLQDMLNDTATKDGKSYMELATLGLIKGAIKGDSRNYKVMLETLGEVNDAQQEELSKLDSILTEIKKDAKK